MDKQIAEQLLKMDIKYDCITEINTVCNDVDETIELLFQSSLLKK